MFHTTLLIRVQCTEDRINNKTESCWNTNNLRTTRSTELLANSKRLNLFSIERFNAIKWIYSENRLSVIYLHLIVLNSSCFCICVKSTRTLYHQTQFYVYSHQNRLELVYVVHKSNKIFLHFLLVIEGVRSAEQTQYTLYNLVFGETVDTKFCRYC